MAACARKVGILFDFDGTIGDTEISAMEVAYWGLAPYFPNIKPEDLGGKEMAEWIRDNCGKPFGEMAEDVDKERAQVGLEPLDELRKNRKEDPAVLSVVNDARERCGLKTIDALREAGEEIEDLWEQSRGEFELALAKLARPCPGVVELLDFLREEKIPFCIATTSPKPRVPISITAADLETYFPADKVHSGESDFVPSRFKPDPSVYLKAANAEGLFPEDCIAFEDSESGVGSAANAGVGMIIGYVGASHIPLDEKTRHAEKLIDTKKSEQERGADIVVWDIRDSIPLIEAFIERRRKDEMGPHIGQFPPMVLDKIEKKAVINKFPEVPKLADGFEPLPEEFAMR
eukprot:CAMPEP_0167749818 /NCGR_PEP_ID=MMETSP0110_2-20121227/5630_1 /TAXON_ID=629695 /ORGANISM="Gymnochlora sp., Strain CCMP2014" /LENGTH=345 /DNA_ID=CAMNT_0007635037 /DNA_START=202 /DNA_END=1235 /DNA_ORIENTATION=+